MADGDSLRYYPAYGVVPLDPLGAQNEVAAAHHLQLLLVQRAHGGLTIGDTHAYDEPFDFDLNESPSIELCSGPTAILGTEPPPVVAPMGRRLLPVHRRRRVARAELLACGLDGHRSGRARHDLLAGHRRRHADGGGGLT